LILDLLLTGLADNKIRKVPSDTRLTSKKIIDATEATRRRNEVSRTPFQVVVGASAPPSQGDTDVHSERLKWVDAVEKGVEERSEQ